MLNTANGAKTIGVITGCATLRSGTVHGGMEKEFIERTFFCGHRDSVIFRLSGRLRGVLVRAAGKQQGIIGE
jgi:hypothetical protein